MVFALAGRPLRFGAEAALEAESVLDLEADCLVSSALPGWERQFWSLTWEVCPSSSLEFHLSSV